MKIVLTTKKVELAVKKQFVTTIFYPKEENYIVYIIKLANSNLYIYLF